jgi:tight adherence protein B
MIKDYNQYQYTRESFIKYFLMGAFLGGVIGFLFYSNLFGMLLSLPIGLIYVHGKKKDLIEERKWQLNLEFRDGLASLSAALNTGYSVENAFYQAVLDLKLMYSADSLIVTEFEGIVNQIQMNQNIEEILEEFAVRTGIEDIENFAEVFKTAKRTGGDIIHIIRTTGNTIHDKIEVKREIRTLITGKKFEANIMSVIPMGIILYLRFCSPGFLEPLYHNLFGFIFMTIILLVYYGVFLLSKKIMNIKV